MIFMQRQTVKGLTTAAGIWATAGMGMAIGAGLYTLGIGTTILVAKIRRRAGCRGTVSE
jgi:putative Mg2+ transporter-C (MgtC) family protein